MGLEVEVSRNPEKTREWKGDGNANVTEEAKSAVKKPQKKICCACPDTKRLRDECIAEHGQDACTKWIDAHLQCLRAEGFKV
ncbi:cytochrome c oxidase copper chaperone 2 [Cryptomeria japonica]|uniref:cytochrome c oxidase copper chaperone 2 n=1 Tax=Cryptomeria japonica TaxID=3369 RepID=UPI0025AD7301|nr:cytochrome c oxidase copper chaperone 2 [Cryptomeria japonica]XP_057815957.1 cytochrome c oxidase copper chaperone 2 [Cryptomeria japonica]XP_057815958.1 cytochrome c oxidase copper chaperone 2 [Cryptomeria japonica]